MYYHYNNDPRDLVCVYVICTSCYTFGINKHCKRIIHKAKPVLTCVYMYILSQFNNDIIELSVVTEV